MTDPNAIDRDPPERCPRYFTGDTGPRCYLSEAHSGGCRYKCAVRSCEGRVWPASVSAHPCRDPHYLERDDGSMMPVGVHLEPDSRKDRK